MRTTLLLLLVLSTLTGQAQKKYGPTNDSLYLGFYRDSISMLERPNLLIIPFHPDRYMSEVDQDIAKGTSYTYQHTRGFFRKGLDNAMIIGAKQHNDYVNLHADDPVLNKDLDFVYKVTRYRVEPYTPPVIVDDQGFKKKLADYWIKLQGEITPEPEPGTRIEKGQLLTVEDHRALITRTEMLNPILVDSLTPKYKADYYVFVSEVDMMIATTNQQALASDNYGRVISAHFTVLDKEGKELFSLIKKEPFSSRENDLENIIRNHYLPLGYEIIYAIDSYRFLQAGLTPLTEAETEIAKNKARFNLPTLQKFK
ncbi:MAG: hypothetical protein HQ500_10320 [Flavobacteriales bacterium]|nr:hypothetical protein [Flavobacteriales bacterium]